MVSGNRLHIACDNPSESLFLALNQKCINLKSLGLDACHLVMMYEQTLVAQKDGGQSLGQDHHGEVRQA